VVKDQLTYLKQPLKLGFFIACDENDVPIEQCEEICACECDKIKAYREAKDRVIFEGFDVSYQGLTLLSVDNGFKSITFNKNGIENEYKTIEDLVKYNLTLTPNALKQFNETLTQK
jgi:hypothetical protein